MEHARYRPKQSSVLLVNPCLRETIALTQVRADMQSFMPLNSTVMLLGYGSIGPSTLQRQKYLLKPMVYFTMCKQNCEHLCIGHPRMYLIRRVSSLFIRMQLLCFNTEGINHIMRLRPSQNWSNTLLILYAYSLFVPKH